VVRRSGGPGPGLAEHLEHRFAPCQREVGELAYGVGTDLDNHAKIGVLLGSGTAAPLAAVILRIRDRHYRTVNVRHPVAEDRDGVPDRQRTDDVRDL
jgi:NhaA family Na+:H+ antiporter